MAGAISTCKHGKSAPTKELERLHESQAGIVNGRYISRHKCCTCAFVLGQNLARNRTNTPSGEARCKQTGLSAPISLMDDLHRSQGGPGRHQCAICALHAGFNFGRRSGRKGATGKIAEDAAEREAEMKQERDAGFQSNAEIRSTIEHYAMKEALRVLTDAGWNEFEDTSQSESYDYTCEKSGCCFFVEVKGTQTDGSSVILTANEVKHARARSSRCIFVVVHSIQITKDRRKIRASGGTARILNPWVVHNKRLKPLQFKWTVS